MEMRIMKLTSFFLALCVIFLSTYVYGQTEEEKNFLLMYFKEDELKVISATRSLMSINRVAENVTVVTAEDIELMNAHTLADVLNTVTGVQIDFRGGPPGGIGGFSIEGSDLRHVAVLIDGISI